MMNIHLPMLIKKLLNGWQVWLIGCLLTAVFLAACSSSEPESAPVLSSQDTAEATIQAPPDCDLMEDVDLEVATGSGFAAPQEALAAIAQTHYLPGVPVIDVENEEVVRWVLQDEAEQPIGLIEANRLAGSDLWQVVQAQWCVEAPPSVVNEEPGNLELVDKSLDCSLVEEAEIEIEEGSGYETPEALWANLSLPAPMTALSVTAVAYGDGGASYMAWIFQDGEQKLGQVTAARAAWGLWVLTSIQQCAPE